MRPRKRPTMTYLIAGRAKEPAQLVGVEVVVARGQALLRPFEAHQSKVGMKIRAKLVPAERVGAHGRIAVQVLRYEGPMRRGLEAGTDIGEARTPGRTADLRCRTRIAVIIVAQRPHLESIMMPPIQAIVVAGLAINFEVK